MTPDAYARFTDAVAARAAADPDVVALVLVGSTSGDAPVPDAWSDHDLFLVTRPGKQERYRHDPGWLPDAERIVLWHRETLHGVKVIWDDGHLAEVAVFDPDELVLARVNRYRVPVDKADVAARMRQVAEATRRRAATERPDTRWLGGQFLGALLVGACRAARGERLSGHALVRTTALAHLVELARRRLSAAEDAAPDDLDPLRRVERGWPTLAAALGTALDRPVPAAALALLDLAEHTFGQDAPWPAAAAKAVRRRLDEAIRATSRPSAL